MMSDGVRVNEYATPGHWYVGEASKNNQRNKALLINIQPITKETAEDVLRFVIEQLTGVIHKDSPILTRAKAVLEKE